MISFGDHHFVDLLGFKIANVESRHVKMHLLRQRGLHSEIAMDLTPGDPSAEGDRHGGASAEAQAGDLYGTGRPVFFWHFGLATSLAMICRPVRR